MNSAITGTFKALVPPGIKEHLKWRLVVSGTIGALLLFAFWSLGWLGMPGFALAAEVKDLQRSADISARISLAQEIRLYMNTRCKAEDREPFDQIIERLQVEYERVNNGQRYPERRCT